MKEFQTKLYNELLELVWSNEAFFFKDQVLDDITYRVFAYRLASYSDFLLPSALECRGIMFEVKDGNPIRLAAMPMEKFFNISENPMTMDLDFNNIKQVMLKMDGSLMSTYIHKGELRIKSKTSLSSDHAINAMRWLDLPEQAEFKTELYRICCLGFTVNLEYTSPEPNMRIVIGYQEPRLTVLNIRSIFTGNYLQKEDLDFYEETRNHWVDNIEVENGTEFIESIANMTGIEGYVIQLNSGQHVKKKTTWYSVLHHTKESINNPRRLYECVLEEAIDDLRVMFADDAYSMKAIADMEIFVNGIYNHLVKRTETFYEENKDLDRKDFAIKGQQELDKKEFAIVMLIYTGKEFSYKELLKKWYDDFGLSDISLKQD